MRVSLRKAALSGLCLGVLTAVAAPASADDEVGDLRTLVSDLYGGDGITLNAGFHEAHFLASGAEELNDLSRVLASNIGAFSFNSSVSSITFDLNLGVPVRTQESLGPLFAERATTIGRGRVNVAASLANTEFKQLDGQDLNHLTLELDHSLVNENTGVPFDAVWDHDHIALDLDLSIDQQVFALYGTYGLTDRLDVGVIVPLVNIEASVTAVATLETTYCDPALFNPANNFQCNPVDAGVGTPVHTFPTGFDPVDSSSGEAFGVGDLLLRGKYNFAGDSDAPISMAVLGQVALPTGDESDLLGTGSPAFEGLFIASGNFGVVSPHLNVGYEYFADDDLDRSNARYVLGVDVSPRPNFGISLETIGRIEEDDDKFFDLAIGGKWAINDAIPIGASILLPLNREEGLRPDYVLTVGIETTF
jgi:hypothetical protein